MAGAGDKQTVGRLALREQMCLLASRRRHVRWRGLESPCSLCFQLFPLRAWRRPIFVSLKVMPPRVGPARVLGVGVELDRTSWEPG